MGYHGQCIQVLDRVRGQTWLDYIYQLLLVSGFHHGTCIASVVYMNTVKVTAELRCWQC